jgi:hypothetical protein
MAGSVKLPSAIQLPAEKQTRLDKELPVGISLTAPRVSTVRSTEGLIYNSTDFTREVAKSLDLNVGFEGIGSFGASRSVKSIENETQSRKYVFKYVIAVVKNYVIELRDDLAGLSPAEEFEQAVAALPASPSPAYRNFIIKFGTHFASRISLGGMAFQSVRTDATTYRKSVETQDAFNTNASLEVEAFKAKTSYEEKKSEIAKRDNETSLTRSSITIVGATGGTSLPDEWFSKLEAQPVPLPQDARLRKLTELFVPSFFKSDSSIAIKRKLLEEEVQRYSNERGGQLGGELRYGDRVRLQMRFPRHNVLMRANPKGIYPESDSKPSRDPETTLVLHDPDNPNQTGHVVYTSRTPNDTSPVAFWSEELKGYIRVLRPQNVIGVSPSPKPPECQWMVRSLAGSLPKSTTEPRQPLASGDELVICRWDKAASRYLRLGINALQYTVLYEESASDPLYAPIQPEAAHQYTFILSKLSQTARTAGQS